jgi:cytoskeletal protein CcmA (bactofilin family)
VDGSKLSIGVNIKLKGVEISDCDVLVIEGQVEATVHSKVMQIDQPGTLNGTALIDVAEIRGEFSGELTARTRLVVHGTGRVSGTVRYGKLIVEEGGELIGDVKRLDAPDAQRSPPAGDARRSGAAESVSPPPNPAYPAASRSHTT